MVGLGAWQIGASWGEVPDEDARAVLRTAGSGVTLVGTADVYRDGRSERFVASATMLAAPATTRPYLPAARWGLGSWCGGQ